MMDLTIATWGPPAGVLLVGAVVGLALSMRKTPAWDHDPRAADLRAEHELLMRQLRDLDADRGKLGETDYATQRAALVEKTGDVLRQLDQGADGPRPAPKTGGPSASMPAYVAMLVVFLLAAGIALQQGVSDRQDGSMTGNAGSGQGGVPEVAAAEAVLAENPNDQAALCTVRKFALFTRDLESAMALMDRSRVEAPGAPCTVVHMAALKVFIGRMDEAQAELATLGSDAPNEARIWRAIIAMQLEDTESAKTLLREGVVNAEDSLERDFASYLLSSLMMPPAQAPQAGGPQSGGPQSGGPQAGAGPAVTGTLQGSAEPGGVLYVYVRSSETERGPPLAALQLKEWALPMEFDLSQAMVIRAIPEEFYVSAKLSRSGDPMVTGPDDLVAKAVGPVKAGDSIELRFE